MAARGAERLPASLAPPVQLMLARAVETIPEVGALPGGAVYEPKWDGYRAIVTRDSDTTRVWSRRGTDLTTRFPDVAAAAAEQIPPGCVVDGELVAWAGEKLDFAGLQRRMAAGPRSITRLVREQPAYFVAFDVLARNGVDVRPRPFAERRALLEDLAHGWAPPLNLSPVMRDRDLAAGWFEDMDLVGLEGLVVKGLAQPYTPTRAMLKVKRRRELDVVCAAVIGPITAPTVVVAGLPLDGQLRIVGRTVPLSPLAAKALVPFLVPAAGEHPWPARVVSATVNGFGANREPVDLTLIVPLVVEVSADAAWSGRTFRHPLTWKRARPDLDPAEVELPDRLA